MRYKLLGKSGLRVSELCLGTMTFGEEWEWGSSKRESRRVFDLFEANGGNFLDTANLYTNGTSENYVGEFVKGSRDKWVIGTKYTLRSSSSPSVNECGNARKNMMQSVEGSLKRLQMEYIDLLWLHAWDYTTPVEEVMRGLDDLVHQGKILYIGISNAPAWIISQANTLSSLRGWTSFVAAQIEYSLKERTAERELIPMAEAFGLSLMPWSPLGGGVLTGKYNKGHESKEKGRLLVDTYKHTDEKSLAIAEVVISVAEEISKTPAQVALRWLIQSYQSLIPILGARREEQLRDNLGCLGWNLSQAAMDRLNQASAISLGYPHEFYETSVLQEFCFGNTLTMIDYSSRASCH